MKKIEAIIRKTKFDDVKEALNAAGIDFFSFWDVRGVGKATNGLRVSKRIEEEGLDVYEHGESAYNI